MITDYLTLEVKLGNVTRYEQEWPSSANIRGYQITDSKLGSIRFIGNKDVVVIPLIDISMSLGVSYPVARRRVQDKWLYSVDCKHVEKFSTSKSGYCTKYKNTTALHLDYLSTLLLGIPDIDKHGHNISDRKNLFMKFISKVVEEYFSMDEIIAPKKLAHKDQMLTSHLDESTEYELAEVQQIEGIVVMNSLDYARGMGLQHKNVLKSIRAILDNDDKLRTLYKQKANGSTAHFRAVQNSLNGTWFIPGEYIDAHNKTQPMFYLTKEGLMELTVNRKSIRAIECKKAMIYVFNQMENNIKKENELKLLSVQEENVELKIKNEELIAGIIDSGITESTILFNATYTATQVRKKVGYKSSTNKFNKLLEELNFQRPNPNKNNRESNWIPTKESIALGYYIEVSVANDKFIGKQWRFTKKAIHVIKDKLSVLGLIQE